MRYALVSTWLGWLLCFSIVFLIPIDVLNVWCFNGSFKLYTQLLQADYDACLDIANATQTRNISYIPNNLTLVDLSTPSEYQNSTCDRPITSLPDTYMQKQWAVLWWGTMIASWYVYIIDRILNFYLIRVIIGLHFPCCHPSSKLDTSPRGRDVCAQSKKILYCILSIYLRFLFFFLLNQSFVLFLITVI